MWVGRPRGDEKRFRKLGGGGNRTSGELVLRSVLCGDDRLFHAGGGRRIRCPLGGYAFFFSLRTAVRRVGRPRGDEERFRKLGGGGDLLEQSWSSLDFDFQYEYKL